MKKNTPGMEIHNWEGSLSKTFPRGVRGLCSTSVNPNVWILYEKDESFKCWALTTNGDYVPENHRTVGKGKPALKGLV